jgi:O-antigen/teichoic acid export membrane protein
VTPKALGARVARHTLLSFAGLAVPLAVALVAIPITVRALGPMRFGLLGLAWAVVEYGGFFDFGLSRATVRFVADALARSPRDNTQIIPVAFATQLVTGVVAGLLVWACAPFLATAVFAIPIASQGEARAMFVAVGANLTIVIAIGALRGALEGAQRFDFSTLVKIPTAVAAIVIPAYGATRGWPLDVILWWVFAARLATLAALAALVPRAVEQFRWEVPREWNRLRELFGYSGWLTLSGLANPILINLDRFALGSIVGVAAVGFYAAPYEGATRLLLVPVSIFSALFPVLTSTEARAERARTVHVLESALRQTTLVMIPPTLAIVALAPEILALWLGPAFAAEASPALRILGVGVFANALAHVPSVFLYSVGRPDLPAKLHLSEVAVHVPLTIFLVSRYGVTGAAAAWAIRTTLDAVGLSILAGRLGSWRIEREKIPLWVSAAGASAILLAVLVVAREAYGFDPRVALLAFIVGGIAFIAVAWRGALTIAEKAAFVTLLRQRQQSLPRRPNET